MRVRLLAARLPFPESAIRTSARAAVAIALLAGAVGGCDCGDPGVGQASTGVTLVKPEGRPDEFERTLAFGHVRVGSLQKRPIVLRNDGVSTAHILSIEVTTESPDFYLDRPTVLPALEAKSELALELRYLAGEIGSDSAKIVITTDVPETEVYTINVSGTGASSTIDVCTTKAGAEVCATGEPDGVLTVDLGEIAPGGELRAPMVVKNLGDAALKITSLGASVTTTAEYTVAPPDGATVPGGAQAAYEIVYLPWDGGPDEGEIEILSDDPQKPRVVVRVRGSGLAPALCVEPLNIDFGEQAIGGTAHQAVKLLSCGREKVTVSSVGAVTISTVPGAPSSRNVFGVTPPAGLPRDLNPGEFIELDVTYTPTHFVTDEGRLSIGNSLSTRPAFVPLHGRGSGCSLSVVPASVNFGTVAAGGGRTTKVVQVRNTGTGDCLVSEIVPPTNPPPPPAPAVAPPPIWAIDQAPLLPRAVGAGDVFQIVLGFEPRTQGAQTNELVLVTNDARGRIKVPLSGNGGTRPKCDFQVTPASLVFSGVNVGQQSQQTVQVKNFGSEECYIVEAKINPSTAPFAAPVSSGPFAPGAAIASGGTASVPVTFKPTASGSFSAVLVIKYGEDPVSGFPIPGVGGPTFTVDVALEGNTLQPALCIDVQELDFGTVNPGDTKEMIATLRSCGAGALGLRGLTFMPGTSTEYTLPAPPRMPQFLAANQSLPVRVQYKPRTQGADFGTLQVLNNDPANSRAKIKLKANAGTVCDKFLACNVDRLAFPTTEVGRAAPLSVVCQNVGTQPVTVTGSHFGRNTSGEFMARIGRMPRTVAPGDSVRVEVVYTPQDTGSDTGSFVLDADTCQPATVNFDGIGKLPNYPKCLVPQPFSPQTKWEWTGGNTQKDSKNVGMAPIVINLDDDNRDGRIDQEDIPDVVFTSCKTGECCLRCLAATDLKMQDLSGQGMLRAIRGKDGGELWSVTDPALNLTAMTQLAAGDIDGDNVPEIIAVKHSFQPGSGSGAMAGMAGKYKQGTLLIFDNTGKLKFETEQWTGDADAVEFNSSPSLSDLEADGTVEILFERTIFRNDGTKLLDLPQSGNDGHGAYVVASDLDGDDKPEILAGKHAFKSDGTLLWSAPRAYNGGSMVLDLDTDGVPEVVLRDKPNEILVLDTRTGAVKRTISWNLPKDENGQDAGVCGAPMAGADLDGDKKPEIIVPSGDFLYAFKANGTILWQQPISDYGGQCGAAGAAAFDFEGDGTFDVVYHDTSHIWIFNGVDGRNIFEAPRNSSTLWETPVIADIDNDNHADILITNENGILGIGNVAGIRALSNVGNNWAATRRIWNQHSYHVSDVNENGSIPRVEVPSWKTTNSWRANAGVCKQ